MVLRREVTLHLSGGECVDEGERRVLLGHYLEQGHFKTAIARQLGIMAERSAARSRPVSLTGRSMLGTCPTQRTPR